MSKLVDTLTVPGRDAATWHATDKGPTYSDVLTAICDFGRCTVDAAADTVQWLGEFVRAAEATQFQAMFTLTEDTPERRLFALVYTAQPTFVDGDPAYPSTWRDPNEAARLLTRFLVWGQPRFERGGIIAHYTAVVDGLQRNLLMVKPL